MIALSAGMHKSGSAWYFNLTNDLLIAAGYQDIRIIRQKFRLHSILNGYNCNMGYATLSKLLRIVTPHVLGETFVVKTHSGPSKSLRYLISLGIMKATFIYRDPRDVVVSAFEHGQKIRSVGKTHTFAQWGNIGSSILRVKQQLSIWDAWMQYGQALMVRYEDLLVNPVNEVERLVDFLGLKKYVTDEDILGIIPAYQPDQLSDKEVSCLHFNKGVLGRFREVMSQNELALCQDHFGEYLQRMGYPE